MMGLILIYGMLIVVAIVLVGMVNTTHLSTSKSSKQPITFIIPFKNEEERLKPLIDSFNKAVWESQFEVIFINDHSTDDSCNLLLNELDIPFKLIRSRNKTGKKQAISEAVYQASYELIHTLDADVSFNKDYLVNISKISSADLTILPVHLSGNTLLQKLNKIEFQWLQTITFALAKIKKPALCNGANLSFSKTFFLKTLAQRTDFNIASGDDFYLLKAVQKNNGHITANSNPHLAIQTPAPNSFQSLISQRKRWIKKVLNGPTTFIILLYALYHILPLIALLNIVDNLLWALPIVLKIIAEWVLSRDYTFKQLGLVILHQVWYLVYGIVLVGSLKDKGKWK